MAVSVVASSNNGAASGTAVSVAAPTGTTTGDLAVCVVHANSQTNTIADNNGATAFTEPVNDYKPNDAGGHVVSIFYRVIQASDPTTYNFTLDSSQRWAAVAATFRGFDTGTNFEITPSTTYFNNENNFDDSNVDAPTVTTSVSGSIHVAGAVMDTGATITISLPASYTDLSSRNTNQTIALCYRIITPAGATGAKSFTLDGDTGARMGFSFVVKNAASTSVKDIIGGFIPFAR